MAPCCCRSLGDFAFKSPQALISAEPYVNTHQLEPSDHLVLLTSDGVTDVVPDDDMLDIGLRAIEQVGLGDKGVRGQQGQGTNILAVSALLEGMQSSWLVSSGGFGSHCLISSKDERR